MIEFLEKYKRIILPGLAVLLLILLTTTWYFYHRASDLEKNPQKVVQEETERIVEKVSRLMVLPEGEVPTIATVSNPEKLKDQVFFTNAKTGQKLLIYTQAKKAILYDPQTDKIVEVAPLNIDTGEKNQ